MSSPTNMPGRSRIPIGGLILEYPMLLGTYDKYEDAQRAVDYLSDHEFAVENCMIVGTDLRQVERVTGRLTRGRVAGAGALSGVWMGLFVGLIFALFDPNSTTWAVMATVAFGALFGLVWAILGYAATKGRRDFTSVSQVVATRYEVLVEHKLAEQGRALLARMPGGQPLTA
ncbi:MAG TPA: general stress protein [Dermatophilaceae bacterium]